MATQEKKQDQDKDLRTQQIEDRKQKMKELNPPQERVRVNPKDDEMRKAMKHPKGIKFPESGSVEWPLDQFTKRRIADGSVTREDDQGQRGGERDRGRAAQQQPAPQRPQQPPQPQQQPPQQPGVPPQPGQPPQQQPGQPPQQQPPAPPSQQPPQPNR